MTNILIRSGVVVTTALALAATTASAQTRTVNVDNSQEGASGGSSQPTKARETRYCLVDQVTGSRIPVKVCKTRKAWKAEGVEIPAGR